ncbi:MAG: hypothetical protein H6538_06920 [Bacteroidales bacterium]|nr:hypothetical protein [Bacteroidales bacterium]MCB8999079.1 hypothetical protein [Bacteroidales bacterium]
MRRIIAVALFLGAFVGLYAQNQTEFMFLNNLKDTARVKIDYSNLGVNPLGPEVARKMYLLQNTYTYVERGTLTAPGDKTIVKKPDIYYSVKKLYNYYKKSVKKGTIKDTDASKQLIQVINKSYSMFYEDTQKFEDYLRTMKKPEDIQKAFDMVSLY